MEYDNFIETIRKRAGKTAGKGGKAFINKVIKNNGKEMDGLVILEDGYSVAPAIYLNDYYDDYRSGTDIDMIMNDILTVYYKNRDAVCFNTNLFGDFKNVKGRIVYRLINYEKNKDLLRDVPHKKFMDLAIVYYCIVKRSESYLATTMIKNEFMENWGVSEELLYELAKKNTPKILKARIAPITGFLNEISGSEVYEVPDETESYMYVMTNMTRVNGASCMLYNGVLEEFSRRLNRDLYILPSSVHELIIVPASDGINSEGLKLIVKDINEKGVADEEVLSDNVYTYSLKERKIIL